MIGAATAPEISFILTVRDDEEVIGYQVKTITSQARSMGRSFEVVAVNDGCCDNSLSMLELLAQRVPELRIIRASATGRAFLRGASEARGTVLVLVEAARPVSLSALGWALSRIAAGREAVILRERYVVARRLTALPVIARATGPGLLFERIFERRAQDLGIDVIGTRPVAASRRARLLAPVLRFLTA
jgi:hypothetical protein